MVKATLKSALLQKAVSMHALFLLLLCCCGRLVQAQDATEVFETYRQVAMTIQNLSYSVNRVDTFLSGERRSITGQCLIRREPDNTLTGCSFSGKRNDLPVSHWYDGKDFYTINDEEKSYSVNHSPGKGILGSVGGQMLCTEFIKPDADYTKLSVTVSPDCYVLRMDFPDLKKYDAYNRYKLLYLDKNTFLLQRIESFQESLDKHQTTSWTFSDVYVNDPITALNLNKSDVLKYYKLNEVAETKAKESKRRKKRSKK